MVAHECRSKQVRVYFAEGMCHRFRKQESFKRVIFFFPFAEKGLSTRDALIAEDSVSEGLSKSALVLVAKLAIVAEGRQRGFSVAGAAGNY